MKYNRRVIHRQAFEGVDHERYTQHARREGKDLTAWIQMLAEKECKRDARKINNRNNKGE